MQAFAPLTAADFLAPTQELLWKVEVWNGLGWEDLHELGGSGGKNYIKSVSISLGGAGASAAPVAGEWSATIDNENGIFHPFHPTSAYSDLLRIGREVRISVGSIYGGAEHFFQRLIGFMDAPRFDHKSNTVEIGGIDYTKLLADTTLRDINFIAESGSGSGSTEVDDIINGPLHWGGRAIFDSVATGGVGAELYAENDACEIGAGEADDIGTWVTGAAGTVTSEGPAQESNFMLRLERDGDWLATGDEYCEDTDVAALTIGLRYIITFWGRIVYNSPDSDGYAILSARQGTAMLHEVTVQGATWTQYSLIVTAVATSALGLRYISTGKDSRAGDYIEIDDISVKSYDPDTWMKYELPAASNGPYFVTLDGEPVGQGDQDSEIGWHYDLAIDAIYFAEEMTIPNGVDNLYVYYYTDQSLDDVLGDVLMWAGLYPSRAAALADLDYTPTGVTLERVWFESKGTTALDAVTTLCERVNYRFWFGYDGRPHFQPAPTADAVDFIFTEPGHIEDLADEQAMELLRNRIIVEGAERAWFQATRDDKASDKWRGEEYDAASIAAYLERTHQVNNHLFQDQASVNAMAIAALAEFKNPKWHTRLGLFANPVPLELGDVIQWVQEFQPTSEMVITIDGGWFLLPPGETFDGGSFGESLTEILSAGGYDGVSVVNTGIIRDIKINDSRVTYVVEIADAPSGSA